MLRFEPIDLAAHASQAVEFRADSFALSFGSADDFFRDFGESGDRYLDVLAERMGLWKNSCVHVWREDQLVGQVELSIPPANPNEGYVNLYYLVPDKRGRGLGASLDRLVP